MNITLFLYIYAKILKNNMGLKDKNYYPIQNWKVLFKVLVLIRNLFLSKYNKNPYYEIDLLRTISS